MRIASRVFRYRRTPMVGTLGDPDYPGLTCSELIAFELFGRAKTVGFSSFEAAKGALLERITDALLVPAAYRRVDAFVQSTLIYVDRVYYEPLPPLVFAGTSPKPPAELESLFIQPATESMVSDVVGAQINQTSSVSSNVAACLAVREQPLTSGCITNAVCAEFFGLTTYQVLRPRQMMPFFYFTRNS